LLPSSLVLQIRRAITYSAQTELFVVDRHIAPPNGLQPLSAATVAAFCSTAAKLAEKFLSNPSEGYLLDFLPCQR
jgi:hypothetical protein